MFKDVMPIVVIHTENIKALRLWYLEVKSKKSNGRELLISICVLQSPVLSVRISNIFHSSAWKNQGSVPLQQCQM